MGQPWLRHSNTMGRRPTVGIQSTSQDSRSSEERRHGTAPAAPEAERRPPDLQGPESSAARRGSRGPGTRVRCADAHRAPRCAQGLRRWRPGTGPGRVHRHPQRRIHRCGGHLRRGDPRRDGRALPGGRIKRAGRAGTKWHRASRHPLEFRGRQRHRGGRSLGPGTEHQGPGQRRRGICRRCRLRLAMRPGRELLDVHPGTPRRKTTCAGCR